MTLAITLSLVIAIMVANNPRRCLSSIPPSLQSSHQIRLNQHCDQEYCDSLVRKCSITKRCNCDFKQNPKCAKDCIDCLEEKFGKCCACVDLCPPHQDDFESSHVGDLGKTSDEQFFQVLTEEDDIHNRWSVEVITDGILLDHPDHGQIELAHRIARDNSSLISHDSNLAKLKCTVAFINRELSMAKCRRSCVTMGASFFRWFHEGCCECVGRYCLKYGVEEPKCSITYD